MFQKVMVVLDPENPSQAPLEKALQLARSEDFELLLFACDHTHYLVDGYYFDAVDVEKLRQEYADEQAEKLEAIADPLRANGLNVTTSAVWSYPIYQGVIDEAERQNVDLVITQTERRDSISRLMLTFDDWQLIRLCSAPLLMVKETPWKKAPTIMAAVDPKHARHKPTGLDHKIMSTCEKLSELIGGELYAVHAFHPVPFSGEYPIDAKTIHAEAFAELMTDFSVEPEKQMLIEELPPFALRQAEEKIDADVIAMGAISRSLVSDVFIGSTTQEVLDFLNCDVLILKPSGGNDD